MARRAPRPVERIAFPVLTAGALMFATHQAVDAQGITGTVHHAHTSQPLQGVLVTALDYRGERVRGTLTDATGRFVLQVPMGRYSLRAERIGLGTEVTDTFDVRTLDLRFVPVRMVERAVLIPGLVVDSRVKACRMDPERAIRIQRWWEDIRTALSVSAVVQRQSIAMFELERYEREWDEDVERIVATNSHTEVSTNSRPFVSEEAEFLARAGFVQGAVAGQRQYYAPDAEVLLSDVFLSGHCFSLIEDGDRKGQLGLHFEPVRDRSISDVEGTLWVDTTTSELQGLEYRYVNVEDLEDTEAGGAVAFEYLASGAWIVSEWHIRMPKLALLRRRRGQELELVGYVDVGGRARAMDVSTGNEATAGIGAIRGIVYDSIRSSPLPDATVTVLGTPHRTTTDAAGAFLLADVPVGSHKVAFYHADTEAWGLGTSFAEVDVHAETTSRVRLAIPGFRQAALGLCLGEGVGAAAVLVGHVLGAEREPLENVPLELSWSAEHDGAPDRPQVLSAVTGSEGRFALCRLPAEEAIALRAYVRGQWVDAFEITLPAQQVVYREVWFTR